MPSTVIANIEYNPVMSTLRVTYVSGKVYDYKDVPQSVYNQMRSWFSKGEYLNKVIKPNYKFEKIR